NASDWYRHQHDKDRAYDNVILHVVFTADQLVMDASGREIPELVLKDLLDYQVYRYYKSWVKAAKFIACENQIEQVPSVVRYSAVESAAMFRLSEKAEYCQDLLQSTLGDLEESFFR